MTPTELNKLLFELTEHEIQYKQGFTGDFTKFFPTIIKDNKKIIKLTEVSDSDVLLKYSSTPLIIKKHSRFQSFPLHCHTWIEFNYMYSGSCTQIIEGSKLKLTKGQMLLLDSDTIHSIEPLGDNDILIVILIKKEYLTSEFFSKLSTENILTNFFLNSITQSTLHNNFLFFKSENNRRFKIFMDEFICEWFNTFSLSNGILNNLFTLIIIELMNIYESDIENNTAIIKTTPIISILGYIEKNYKTCTLSTTASYFNMNSNYLSNLLKKHTGYSFKSLIQQKKFNSAQQLLKNTNLPITEIANLIGYENITFFYKKFRDYYNYSPKEYRDNNAKNK